MSIWPNDYDEKVLKDIEKYNNSRKVIKAGLIERCLTKFCDPNKLHPNPEDEFSKEEIGPNLEIIEKYTRLIRYIQQCDTDIFEEPIIVQKMKPDGYLLLNGHHRWFAALRMKIKRLHIQIVNLVSNEDVERMIDKTTNNKLVSFDFDEVLLTTDLNNQAPITDTLFSRKYKERLRFGAPEVIKELQKNDFDVCVYSSGYLSEEDINNFFSMYEISVNIIVNGFNDKRKNNNAQGTKEIKSLIDNKYKRIVHIDNEILSSTNHKTKEYEIHDLKGKWHEAVIQAIAVIKQ